MNVLELELADARADLRAARKSITRLRAERNRLEAAVAVATMRLEDDPHHHELFTVLKKTLDP